MDAATKALADRVELNSLLRASISGMIRRTYGEAPSWPPSDSRWRQAVAELRMAGIMSGDDYAAFLDSTD